MQFLELRRADEYRHQADDERDAQGKRGENCARADEDHGADGAENKQRERHDRTEPNDADEKNHARNRPHDEPACQKLEDFHDAPPFFRACCARYFLRRPRAPRSMKSGVIFDASASRASLSAARRSFSEYSPPCLRALSLAKRMERQAASASSSCVLMVALLSFRSSRVSARSRSF